MGRKFLGPRPPRKAASECCVCPYRKPTLVGRGTSPQVDERTSVKELGKLTPYLRKKGCPSSLIGLRCLVGRGGRSETAQATVYQKHRSLPTRKRTYRG